MKKAQWPVGLFGFLEAAYFALGNTVQIQLPSDMETGLCLGSEQGREAVLAILCSGARLMGCESWFLHLRLCDLGGDSHVPTLRLQFGNTFKAHRTVPGTW